jgi:hypothetical protein
MNQTSVINAQSLEFGDVDSTTLPQRGRQNYWSFPACNSTFFAVPSERGAIGDSYEAGEGGAGHHSKELAAVRAGVSHRR